MSLAGFAWECRCGALTYGEEEPEECSACNRCSAFVKLPEELVEERERDLAEEKISDDSDTSDITPPSTRAHALSSVKTSSKNKRRKT